MAKYLSSCVAVDLILIFSCTMMFKRAQLIKISHVEIFQNEYVGRDILVVLFSLFAEICGGILR